MKKRILAALIASATVLSLAGCKTTEDNSSGSSNPTSSNTDTDSDAGAAGTADAGDDAATEEAEYEVSGGEIEEDSIVVWMWNTDVYNIIENVLKDYDPELYSKVRYVNTGGSDTYQDKLDNILSDPTNELYPDVIALEADYILKYTNGSNLLPVSELGITADDYANQYEYTVDIGTSAFTGEVVALSWQACPGGWAIRASLAEELLGTSDPDELQEYFKDWDTFLETARKVKEASGDATRIIQGYDDLKRVYMGAREIGWYDASLENPTLTIEDPMLEYIEMAKTLYDEELTFNTTQWAADWYAAAEGDQVLAFPSCTWHTYWTLNADNRGDYVLIDGPQSYSWGGTWLAATAEASNTETVAKFIKYLTCDADFMAKINDYNTDYVNNSVAIQTQIDNDVQAAVEGVAVLSDKQGESLLSWYSKRVDAINGGTLTDQDQTINSLWDTQVQAYATGSKDLDTAIADFKTSVADAYSWINVE